MSDEPTSAVRVRVDDGVAYVVLDRPEKRNAFDDRVAAHLERAFCELAEADEVHCAVLGGQGPVFCSGADLAWMRKVADYTPEENLRDATAFQDAFDAIDRCPKPVIARVQGAALAGGVGLVAVCDIVVAANTARFGFPDVRVGLVPGVITPYVVRKMGIGHARHLFLTGAAFGAEDAWRLGLVHHVVPEAQLDATVRDVIQHLKAASPDGLRRAKALVEAMADATSPDEAAAAACQAIAEARASRDGREGALAFLERRRPHWQDS